MIKTYPNATMAWLDTYNEILLNGTHVSPRGTETLELLNNSFAFDMKYPICYHQHRKLAYGFLAAEADWITRGSNLVADLTPYNKRMADFSDDGVYLSGAYGIPYNEQFDYVLAALCKDINTRQAVMTIWGRNPKDSKDIPCTVAMSWNIRNNRLNCHVFMRSSDAHLGLPYDMFSFTIMTLRLLCAYNCRQFDGSKIIPGNMYMNLASSHIYEQHYKIAQECLMLPPDKMTSSIPEFCYDSWDNVYRALKYCMDKEVTCEPIWYIRPL